MIFAQSDKKSDGASDTGSCAVLPYALIISFMMALALVSCDEETLAAFLQWGISEYPAAGMGLVLWNHGSGSINGICYDELYDDDALIEAFDEDGNYWFSLSEDTLYRTDYIEAAVYLLDYDTEELIELGYTGEIYAVQLFRGGLEGRNPMLQTERVSDAFSDRKSGHSTMH
jgi:hypothetical protein